MYNLLLFNHNTTIFKPLFLTRTPRVRYVAWRKSFSRHKKCQLVFCFIAFSNMIPHSFESLTETCIPSIESFEPMVTKLCSRQEMLYKINQRGIIKKRNKVELRFLCTALRVIARNMHIKYGVIRTYGDKVMLRTRNALYNQSKGNN